MFKEEEMGKSVIIIGAGLAGLSAGCYGQMNGYKTRILEMDNARPGGLCTSWKRKGYTMDGCIHMLMGSRTGMFHRFFQELGAVQDLRIVDHEEYIRVEGTGGKTLIVYADLDRLEQHMKELSPADAGVIEEICNIARIFTHNEFVPEKPMELMGLLDKLKMLTKMQMIRAMSKYGKISIQDYALRFSDPFLREAFPRIFEELPDLPMSVALLQLADLHNRNRGLPIGGSLELARAIERRYLNLGGEVHYKSRVDKILVDDDRAVGVRLTDGTEHNADIVISAADGRTTIFDMLEGKHINDKIRSYYNEWPICGAFLQISLGVARDFSNEPHSVMLPFDEPINVGDKKRSWVHMRHYCYDPTMAPSGKSVFTVYFVNVDHKYWKELYEDRQRYKAEKQGIADAVIDQMEKRFPGIKDEIEVVDVTTPVTYERYTGTWQGSYMGWGTTTETIIKWMSRTLPGLGSFYMAGHWVFVGCGVNGAVMSGRHVMQVICKKDNKKFVTSTP
ncbi:phytoene desaturase family protein [Chloroflexota bacterium]